jgi:hypothetical protein
MIVQSTLLMMFLPNKDKVKKDSKLQAKQEKEFKDRIAVLTIAYHNLAVEQEFLKSFNEAVESYRLAAEYAEKYLGATDGITINLKTIYDKA